MYVILHFPRYRSNISVQIFILSQIYGIYRGGEGEIFEVLAIISDMYIFKLGTAVARWLRCSVTNRKVAGSIRDDTIGIFH